MAASTVDPATQTNERVSEEVDASVSISESNSASVVERELPLIQTQRRVEHQAMARESNWSREGFLEIQDALLRATPNECTVEDERLHNSLCEVKQEVIKKRRHIHQQLELYNEISTDVSSAAQRLSNLKRRTQNHYEKVSNGMSVWNQAECSADALAVEVDRIKKKFFARMEKLKEELDQLHDESLHDLVLQVDGTDQAFNAYSQNHRKQSAKEAELLKELRRTEAAVALLEAEMKKLEQATFVLSGQQEEIQNERSKIKGELTELAKTNKAELRAVLTNITKKKISLTADIDNINIADSGMDELDQNIDARADKAFADSAKLEFEGHEARPVPDHIILATTEEACSGPHSSFLKFGLNHFTSKRVASRPNAADDSVSLIAMSNDGALVRADRTSMSVALALMVEKDTPVVESISFTDMFKLVSQQVEKHQLEHPTANTIIMFITGTRPNDMDDLQQASDCAAQVHKLASDAGGTCHGISLILGQGVVASDVAGLCLGLNGGQNKGHTCFAFAKPTLMWRSFDQIATDVGPKSHMSFRNVASVTQKYAQYMKVHKQHVAVKRRKQLERKEKELEQLNTAGENAKKRLNEMKTAMTEHLESEEASHAKLAESLSEEMTQAETKVREMKNDIALLKDKLAPLRSELDGLQKSATTAADLEIFKSSREKLLKLNAWDQDAFKAAGNASLDTWETIKESLNLRNHAISVFLSEMSTHLEALSSSSISSLDPLTAVQRVLAKYCEEGVITEVKPSIASKNWIGIVQHHKPETEDFSDKDVELFARNMPMKEFLAPGVTLEQLKAKLLENLTDGKEFSGFRKAFATSKRRLDTLKKKAQAFEDDLEELAENDKLDGDAKREIHDEIKGKLDDARGDQRDAEADLKQAKDELNAEIQEKYHKLFDMIKDIFFGVETMHTGVVLAAGADEHVQRLMDLESTLQICGGPVVQGVQHHAAPVKALTGGVNNQRKELMTDAESTAPGRY